MIATAPALSARELGTALGLTSRAVEMQLRLLKQAGRLRRIGPAKGGSWLLVPWLKMNCVTGMQKWHKPNLDWEYKLGIQS